MFKNFLIFKKMHVQRSEHVWNAFIMHFKQQKLSSNFPFWRTFLTDTVFTSMLDRYLLWSNLICILLIDINFLLRVMYIIINSIKIKCGYARLHTHWCRVTVLFNMLIIHVYHLCMYVPYLDFVSESVNVVYLTHCVFLWTWTDIL